MDEIARSQLCLPLPRKFDFGPSHMEAVMNSIRFRMMCDMQRPRLGAVAMPTAKEILDDTKDLMSEIMSPEEKLLTLLEFGID